MLLKDNKLSNENKLSTKKIALVGILSAIAVIAVYFESILPVNKLTLFALSSFLVSIIVIEAGIKASFLFYTVTSLLMFIVIPKKTSLIPYALFFGYYGIFKYYVEKIKILIPKILLKQLFFNICFYIIYQIFGNIFFPDFLLNIEFPFYIIAIICQFIFILYDYVYTLFISYYRDKIRGKLKLGN